MPAAGHLHYCCLNPTFSQVFSFVPLQLLISTFILSFLAFFLLLLTHSMSYRDSEWQSARNVTIENKIHLFKNTISLWGSSSRSFYQEEVIIYHLQIGHTTHSWTSHDSDRWTFLCSSKHYTTYCGSYLLRGIASEI